MLIACHVRLQMCAPNVRILCSSIVPPFANIALTTVKLVRMQLNVQLVWMGVFIQINASYYMDSGTNNCTACMTDCNLCPSLNMCT